MTMFGRCGGSMESRGGTLTVTNSKLTKYPTITSQRTHSLWVCRTDLGVYTSARYNKASFGGLRWHLQQGEISVPLTTNERQALVTIAERECRDPHEHLRFILRREAQALGLLPDERVVGLKNRAVQGDTQMSTKNDQTLEHQQF